MPDRPLINNTNFNSFTHWIDSEKKIHNILDIDDRYLNNIINFLRSQFPGKDDDYIGKAMKAFNPMRKELERRKRNELGKYKPSIFETRDW